MTVAELAARQLAAYNAHDLDAFVACYHPQVQVWMGGELDVEGIEAFRARYVDMFDRGGFGASVPERVVHSSHCVDLEHWWRLDAETGARKEGTVLVHYTERDGRLHTVRFFD